MRKKVVAAALAFLFGAFHLLHGQLSSVEHPVMVRAENDDVFNAIQASVLSGDYVANITRRLVPSTEGAFIFEYGKIPAMELSLVFEFAARDYSFAAFLQKAAVSDAGAFPGAILSALPCGSVKRKRVAADRTEDGFLHIACPESMSFSCSIGTSPTAIFLIRERPTSGINQFAALFAIFRCRVSVKSCSTSLIAESCSSQNAGGFEYRFPAVVTSFGLHQCQCNQSML